MSAVAASSGPPPGRGQARDFGLRVGSLPPGAANVITDVPGVRVGQRMVWKGEPGGTEPWCAPA